MIAVSDFKLNLIFLNVINEWENNNTSLNSCYNLNLFKWALI